MNDVARCDVQKLAQLQDSVGMGEVVEWKRKGRKLFRLSAFFQFALFLTDDDLAVASLPKPLRKLQQLALAAAQSQACVDMSDLQGPRGSHG
jgi:hypothetical protein